MKQFLVGLLVVVVSGCVSIPEQNTVQFKGGAKSDHRPLPGMTWVPAATGAVKTPCRVATVRKEGQAIYLDC